MFQPNRPQWVTIVVTFYFAVITVSASSQAAVFVVVAGALVVWWLEGRRQKRSELQRGAEAARRDLGRLRATDDIEADVPTAHVNSLRKAAEQGDAGAQVWLGVLYRDGRGVPQDYVEAHKWSNLAASRATGDDRKEAAESRDVLAARMTPAQLAEAQQLAREWHAAFDVRQE